APRRTEQGDELAGRQRQAEAVQRDNRAVASQQALEPDLDARTARAERGGFVGHRTLAERTRVPSAKDSTRRRRKANSSEATDTAMETPALARPSMLIATCRLT